MSLSRILPLPVTDGISPIGNITDNHKEGNIKEPATSYYFTIPLKSFRPSPCKLSDIADSQQASQHLQTLVIIFHLINRMFYSSNPNIMSLPNNGGRKIRVFMEYITFEDTDMQDDISLIDTIGIRFHFHFFCNEINFLDGIKQLSESNGGEPIISAEAGMDDDGEKPRKPPKKKPNGKQKKSLPRIYNAYEKIDNLIKWFDLSNAYMNYSVDRFSYTFDTQCGDSFVPYESHELHPDRVFTWENSCLEGMSVLQKSLSPDFPFPELVYELPIHLLVNTAAICTVVLPRTPLWFEQTVADQVNTLQSFCNKEYLDAIFFDKFLKRNDIKELAVVQSDKIKKLESKYNDSDLDMEMLRFRERTVKNIANCFRPGANVSNPIVLMTKWAAEKKTWTTEAANVDPNMTYFGNMVAKDFIHFEQDLRFSVTHSIFFRVLVNALGAYRYKLDLHNNVLMLGAGASGKSHILDTIAGLLVPGTTMKVSHATEKAATIGSDNNDHISLYHELPPGFLGNDKNGSETGNHIIKDMMTSCTVNTVSIVVDNDLGTREASHFESECVGVVLGATNERADRIPEALSTRMIKMMVNEYTRDGFGVNEMTSEVVGVRGGDYINVESTKLFENRWRTRQVMSNMVEKMIYTKTLVDVDMSVFNLIQLRMMGFMENHDITTSNSNIRDLKFMRHFARTLTILFACDKFANDPSSIGYEQEFSFKTLQKIQPLLFCTEEIALFTMTLNADQLINVHHFKLIEVLLAACKNTMYKNSGIGDEWDIKNGMYYTQSKYPDERKIYRDLIQAQTVGDFKEKLSAENLKVAFNEIRRQVFRGSSILLFDNSTQSISINVAYIEKHFEFDYDVGRYKCKFDLNNLMQDVYNKSYANTFTKDRKMLVGTTLDPQAPFLLNTFHQIPNENHVLSHNLAISTNNGTMSFSEETNDYCREGSVVKYKRNFETFVYHEYVSKCGYTEDLDIENLYRPALHSNTITTYPIDFATWFTRFSKSVTIKRISPLNKKQKLK